MRSRLFGPDDKPLEPPTLFDIVQEASNEQEGRQPILPIVEALAKRNAFLMEDLPWQAKISPIFDAKGRPYLRLVK